MRSERQPGFALPLSIAVLGLLFAGCKDDLKPVIATWTPLAAQWQSQVDLLTTDDVTQTRKVNGLCSTEGLDPGNVATKTCAELKVTSQSDKAQLETLVAALSRHRQTVDATIVRGKRLEVSVVMEAAKTELTALIARATDNAQLRREASKQLQTVVDQELDTARALAVVAAAKAMKWKQASTERTPLELTEIRFTRGTAQLEGPEAGAQSQLQEVIVWANSCPALSFSINAHESKELAPAQAKKLTDGRAAAVRKFLVDNGVAASKIVGATGNGSTRPIVDEPEAASLTAAAMNPEELEALRNKNRRVTIQAVEVCQTAERAELSAP